MTLVGINVEASQIWFHKPLASLVFFQLSAFTLNAVNTSHMRFTTTCQRWVESNAMAVVVVELLQDAAVAHCLWPTQPNYKTAEQEETFGLEVLTVAWSVDLW